MSTVRDSGGWMAADTNNDGAVQHVASGYTLEQFTTGGNKRQKKEGYNLLAVLTVLIDESSKTQYIYR